MNLLEAIRILVDAHTSVDEKGQIFVQGEVSYGTPVSGTMGKVHSQRWEVKGWSGASYSWEEYIAAWRMVRNSFGESKSVGPRIMTGKKYD